uniref:Rab family protein n=1 Tax=Volvariella volvacea TaxID=36659 RepID=A0A1B2U6Z2_9AGAR|nr:Rab family protein [Volvariella volvacea]
MSPPPQAAAPTSANGTAVKPVRTIKLVVVGASGAGKTSLRGQYISGKFTTGYRATIGTDFITKTLPWPSEASLKELDSMDAGVERAEAEPGESGSGKSVALQIWDTAGQERFSSLSSAFFRGADAVILLYDVNDAESLHVLRKWWDDFSRNVPLPEPEVSERDGKVRASDEVQEFCVVFVGNKVDLVPPGEGLHEANSGGDVAMNGNIDAGGRKRVTKHEVSRFIESLIPLDSDGDEQPSPSWSLPTISASLVGIAPASIHSQGRIPSSTPSSVPSPQTPIGINPGLNSNTVSTSLASESFSRPLQSRQTNSALSQTPRVQLTCPSSSSLSSSSSSLSDQPTNHHSRSNSNSSQHPPTHPYLARRARNRLSQASSHRLSGSQSQFFGGTMASRTTLSIYHTPSSSLSIFDVYQSARSSPEPPEPLEESWQIVGNRRSRLAGSGARRGLGIDFSGTNGNAMGEGELSEEDLEIVNERANHVSVASSSKKARSASPTPSPAPLRKNGPKSAAVGIGLLPNGSASSGSIATITPSTFARQRERNRRERRVQGQLSSSNAVPSISAPRTNLPLLPPSPIRGPASFFTSAKTGEGVKEVFEYVVKRVVRKWEYEEGVEARRLHFLDHDWEQDGDDASGSEGEGGYKSDGGGGGGWSGLGRMLYGYASPYSNGNVGGHAHRRRRRRGHTNGNGNGRLGNASDTIRVKATTAGGTRKDGGIGGCCT